MSPACKWRLVAGTETGRSKALLSAEHHKGNKHCAA